MIPATPAHSRSRAVIGPLGCYLRDAGERVRLSDRLTSLLALHRVLSEAAFNDPLWSRSDAAVCRSLLVRLRPPSLSDPRRA